MFDSRATTKDPSFSQSHFEPADHADLLWRVAARLLGFGAILGAFAFVTWGLLAPFF